MTVEVATADSQILGRIGRGEKVERYETILILEGRTSNYILDHNELLMLLAVNGALIAGDIIE